MEQRFRLMPQRYVLMKFLIFFPDWNEIILGALLFKGTLHSTLVELSSRNLSHTASTRDLTQHYQ
jgi:hypothetical protein